MHFLKYLLGSVVAAVSLSVGSIASAEPASQPHEAMPLQPTEPGQGAFAAIAEIVDILRADPETDWSHVDITALREHLVDMNEVFPRAEAQQRIVPGGLEILATGDGRTGRAVRAMVPAHAPELDALPGWDAEAEIDGNGVRLLVTSTDPALAEQIRALGFFGLMATGAHHQAHHLGIARGQDVHRH